MRKGDKFDLDFIVDENICSGFINLFKDNNPLHTDIEFAQSKGFQSKVVHGNILGGFISYFIGEGLPLKNVIIHSQEIKYYAPVFLNDCLAFTAVIIDIFESVGVVIFDFLFCNQSNKRVAKGTIQIGII